MMVGFFSPAYALTQQELVAKLESAGGKPLPQRRLPLRRIQQRNPAPRLRASYAFAVNPSRLRRDPAGFGG
jgi:hypothetical protein